MEHKSLKKRMWGINRNKPLINKRGRGRGRRTKKTGKKEDIFLKLKFDSTTTKYTPTVQGNTF